MFGFIGKKVVTLHLKCWKKVANMLKRKILDIESYGQVPMTLGEPMYLSL